MKPMPIVALIRFRNASERLVVAAFLMISVSSDSLLRSSPVEVTSKKAISCCTIKDKKMLNHMDFTATILMANDSHTDIIGLT